MKRKLFFLICSVAVLKVNGRLASILVLVRFTVLGNIVVVYENL